MRIRSKETRIIKNLKKIFLNQKIVELINALTGVHKLGYYSYIGREIGYDPYKLSKIINKLNENGIEFTAAIDYSKIGLDILLVFIEKHFMRLNELPYIEWVRSYSLTKDSFGTYIQYYIPHEYRKDLVYDILKELKKKVDQNSIHYYYFDRDVRKQFKLITNIEKHPLVTGYSFNELTQIFDELLRKKYYNNFIVEYSRPHDIVDLMLVKEFEKNAFATIYDLAKKLSMPIRILNKHLNNHILQYSLIKGIYMKTGIFVKHIGEPLIIIMTTKNYDYYKTLISLFEKLENTIGIMYSSQLYSEISSDNYVIHAGILETINRKDDIYYFLFHLYNEGYIENIKTIRFIKRSFRKFTIPYQNFLQEKRYWDLDTERTQRLFERRFIKRSTF